MKKLLLSSLVASIFAVTIYAKPETDTFKIDAIEQTTKGCKLTQTPQQEGMNYVFINVKDKQICQKIKKGKMYSITFNFNEAESGEESTTVDLVKIKL